MIRIVTDSSAQLNPEWVRQNNIVVLPHHITVNGTTYREGIDLDGPTLGQKIAEATRAGQSIDIQGPTVEEFSEAYRALADEKVDVISLHVSAALSMTVAHATQAYVAYRGRCNIQVVDSRCVALGLHELVHAAQKAIDRRMILEDVVQYVRGLISHVYGIFVSDDMKVLERSKRLRPAQAELGHMLGVIPCLSLEDGDIVAIEKVRNSEKAVERLAEFASEFEDFERLAILQLVPELHTTNEQIQQLIESIQPAFPGQRQIPVESCGPIIGSIIGPAGYGIMIYEGDMGLR